MFLPTAPPYALAPPPLRGADLNPFDLHKRPLNGQICQADGWQLPVSAGSPSERSMWRGRPPHRRLLQSAQPPDCPWLAAPPPASDKAAPVLLVSGRHSRSHTRTVPTERRRFDAATARHCWNTTDGEESQRPSVDCVTVCVWRCGNLPLWLCVLLS